VVSLLLQWVHVARVCVLMGRSSLHLHELVNCRWVEEVTQQLDSLQQQSPGSAATAACKDMFVVSFLLIVSVNMLS